MKKKILLLEIFNDESGGLVLVTKTENPVLVTKTKFDTWDKLKGAMDKAIDKALAKGMNPCDINIVRFLIDRDKGTN